MFGIDFAGTLGSTVGSMADLMTLTVKTAGAYNASDPAAGTSPSSTVYSAVKGHVTEWKQALEKGDGPRYFDGEIVVFLSSLPAGVRPASGDSLTFFRPNTSTTHVAVVYEVDVPPDGSQAICKVHG